MELCQIALSTTDLMRSAHWYCRTFDWVTAGRRRENEGDIWARVPGLPEAKFAVWCLVDPARQFFQFELFEFQRPRMRLQHPDARANDIGYSLIGIHVRDFDLAVARILQTGGQFLREPLGSSGERRVCLQDPEGVLIELMEDEPSGTYASHSSSQAEVRCVRISVHDLDHARRFWVDTLGLEEVTGVTLHTREHEALWHLSGCKRTTLLLRSGGTFIELVKYTHPVGRNKPAGYLLSDQGILNVALGTTDRGAFERLYAHTQRAGFRTCYPPWTLPEVATVAYLEDGRGLTVELLCVEPQALARMGFVADVPATTA
jgi:catechol 2,3-dioxygenase-like lactoylglutathione lyase family enzyme